MDDALLYSILPSPVGPLFAACGEDGLRRIGFAEGEHPEKPDVGWRREQALPIPLAEQLEAYFAGDLQRFDLPLAPRGTPFQLRVWEALLDIPRGRTTTYGELARRLGDIKAVRAVGAANGRNPLPIVVPCHRVVGADGSLIGYGGGLAIKEALLHLEGVDIPRAHPQLSLL